MTIDEQPTARPPRRRCTSPRSRRWPASRSPRSAGRWPTPTGSTPRRARTCSRWCRRTGYTPNVAGRSLRAARSRMVLVVVPTFITPFFSDLLLGVDRALTERGYGLLIGNLHDGAAKEERAGRSGPLRPGRRRAPAQRPHPARRRGLARRRRRADGGGQRASDRRRPAGGAGAGARGRRRRGPPSAGARPPPLRLRHRTRRAATSRPSAGPASARRWRRPASPPAPSSAIPATSTSRSGHRRRRSYSCAQRRRRPTAVFAVSDMMAIGFMRAVHAAGLVVPGDRLGGRLRRHRVRRLLRAAADHRAPAARGDGPRGRRAADPHDPRRADPGRTPALAASRSPCGRPPAPPHPGAPAHDLATRRRPLRGNDLQPMRPQRPEAARACRWASGTISAATSSFDTARAMIRRAFDLGITPFRPGQQLRPAPRLGRGDLRPRARGRSARPSRRAHHLDQGRLSDVARPLRRVGLAQISAGQPRPEPAAHGPRLCRHLLLAPARPGDAAGGDDGCARPGGPLGQGALCRHLVLLGRADAPRPPRSCASSARPA